MASAKQKKVWVVSFRRVDGENPRTVYNERFRSEAPARERADFLRRSKSAADVLIQHSLEDGDGLSRTRYATRGDKLKIRYGRVTRA